jgi:hypothetical protein
VQLRLDDEVHIHVRHLDIGRLVAPLTDRSSDVTAPNGRIYCSKYVYYRLTC